ncbi:CX3C chemokine receptor 1-like [Sceloporus undulatus]|uniref:CX3C chemokine receptor 1-like n=1 Tax=Sceloporus undulatus TaxID=8520 RepID=UPI001C4C09A9|nr:CX3C chemokine receptor 1-like [Sceloporus undulatus]
MDFSLGISEIVACVVLISSSVIGNTLLIYCTRRCISEHLRTSFMFIFSLAYVHLINSLVVDVLKIVYASGVGLDSAGCKTFTFTTASTSTLAIWFTLYIAWLYCFKLCRIVHPPVEATSTNHRKFHLVLVFVLWVAALGVCSPLLIYTGRTGLLKKENETCQQFSRLIYAECKTEYKNYHTEIFYGKIFLVAIDLLPLLVMLPVGFRIIYLLWEHKKATYGGIWIGDDAAETEVLRACKLVLLLIFLIISFWTSYFVLFYCLKNFKSYCFAPPILTVLSSGYSAVSPYLLILINYKVQVKMRCFFCKGEKKPVSLATVSPVDVSPYA